MPLPPWIPRDCSCPSTDWSIVRAAAAPNDAAGKAALENLCRRYWYPIYAFIRRRGTPEARAQDLTQAFFAHVLEKGVLAAADPQRGSFGAFLRTACRNFLINQWESGQSDVLNRPVVSLNALREAAGRFALEPPAPDPEAGFDLDWAFAVLTNALEAVRSRYAARCAAALFDELRAYLPLHDGELPGPQAEAAKRLAITVGNFKKKLHELRQEFARQVRYEVAQTLSNPEDVEQEIGQLLASVRHLGAAAAAHPGEPAQEAR